MKRSTILVAVAVAVVTAALTAQAGAVPGPVAQQETPTDGEPMTPTDGTATPTGDETPTDGTPTAGTPTEGEPMTPEEDTPTETPDDGVGVPADNETSMDNETEDGPSLTFEDQESNGTTVTVSDVTLTDPGYVVIHDDSLATGATVDSVIGVSDYLPAGTYDNVTVTLFDVPGANYTADGDQTVDAVGNETNDIQPQLEGTQELTAMLHEESSVGMADNETSMDNETSATDGMTPTETPTADGETPTADGATPTETPTADGETPTADGATPTESPASDNETMGADNETVTTQNQTFDFVETVSLLDPPVLVNDMPVTDTANVTVEDTAGTETGTMTDNETGTPTDEETGTPTEDGAGALTDEETGTPTGEETGTATGTPTEPGTAEGTASPTTTP